MKISTNFTRSYYEFGLKPLIDIISEAGFEGMDFNADLREFYTDVHDENFYKEIKKYANDKGITFVQTHAPFDSSFTDEEKTKLRFNEIVQSMKNSAWLGANMIVVHPCKHIAYDEKSNHEYMMDYNYNFYKNLIPYAEEFGIKVAIENIGGCVSQSPKGLLELVHLLDNEVFTVCYDVGHANICAQDPADMIRALGKHIGCTHVHDNEGRIIDMHTLPYYGTIDWESVMKAFAEIGYEGDLSYEAGAFLQQLPLELRKEGIKYMAKVGKYLVERYWHYKNMQ